MKAWDEVVSKIGAIKYNGKTKVIRFTDGAYQMYRHWFNNGRDIMERSSSFQRMLMAVFFIWHLLMILLCRAESCSLTSLWMNFRV